MDAAMTRAAVWMPKEKTSVERRRGGRARERWIKKMLPSRKTVNAMRDFAQRKAGYSG